MLPPSFSKQRMLRPPSQQPQQPPSMCPEGFQEDEKGPSHRELGYLGCLSKE